MEANFGSFMVEMKDISYIIQNVTNKSLILIDELGRGTSNTEGTSIAWYQILCEDLTNGRSICEYLLSLKAYTVFVTHFIQLTELANLYPNVKNYHLMVTTNDANINFMYSIAEGSCNEERYVFINSSHTGDMGSSWQKCLDSHKK